MHTFFALVKAKNPNADLFPPHLSLKLLKLNGLEMLVINCKSFITIAPPKTCRKIL
jgi:hypothetical protein